MEIFNVKIWGEDADKFAALSCAKKKDWIKKNTNQKSDVLIDEFIKHFNRGKDGEDCEGCKEEKQNGKGNISSGLANEVASTPSVGENSQKNSGTSSSGPKPKPQKSKEK